MSQTFGFRDHIPLERRARIWGWLGDSRVWMNMAVDLDRASGRGRDDGGDMHAANSITKRDRRLRPLQ